MMTSRPIFISYRRKDSADVTGRIYDRLSSYFGRELVFKDVNSIPFGTDFRQYLDEQICQCRVMIVVIGHIWLCAADDAGNRRIDDPTDWVRLEIETALQHKIPIIPLLVSGAQMPRVVDLPISLRPLAYQNAARARPDPDFYTDMDLLIKGLEEQFDCTKVFRAKNNPSESVNSPRVPQVWLYGWDQYKPSEEDEPADLILNWNDYYHKPSTFPSLSQWNQSLAPQLTAFKQEFDGTFSNQTIELRSTLPLAPMIAVGHTFSKAGHYKLKIKQGDEIWQSYGISPSSLRFKVETTRGRPGQNLLMGFGITGNAWTKVEQMVQDSAQLFDAVVYVQLDKTRLGSMAINNADAIALAAHAKDLIRHYQQQNDATSIHLIVFSPAAYALFLGQYLNQLGEIIVYEFAGSGYQPAVRLIT